MHGVTQRQVVRATVELSQQVVFLHHRQICSATNAPSDLQCWKAAQIFFSLSFDIEAGPVCHRSAHGGMRSLCCGAHHVHRRCGVQLHRVSWASVGVVLFELNMVDRYAADIYD